MSEFEAALIAHDSVWMLLGAFSGLVLVVAIMPGVFWALREESTVMLGAVLAVAAMVIGVSIPAAEVVFDIEHQVAAGCKSIMDEMVASETLPSDGLTAQVMRLCGPGALSKTVASPISIKRG